MVWPAAWILLQRGTGPFEAEALRQGRVREPRHRGDRLARADAGRRAAVDGDAAVVVVAHDRLRPRRWCAPRRSCAAAPSRRSGCGHGSGRCRRPQSRSSCLGLQVDLPGAAEQVEVVDVVAAERRLQRVEHVADADAERLHLVAVDIEVELRRVGRVGGEHAGSSFGSWLAAKMSPRATAARSAGSPPRRSWQLVLEAAAGAEADDRRHVEGDDVGLADRPAPRPRTLAMIESTASPAPVRSSNGLSSTMKIARCWIWLRPSRCCSRRPC